MNNDFEKIGAYRVVNYLLPGAVFCYAFEVIIDQKIIRENIIESILQASEYAHEGSVLTFFGSGFFLCGLRSSISELLKNISWEERDL